MEVYLHNVPKDWTDRSLRQLLDPPLKVLGIRDYDLNKPRHKHFAFVTFLSTVDGQRFLDSHGSQLEAPPLGLSVRHPNTSVQAARHAKPRATARLRLANCAIFCKLNNRKPCQSTLKHLQHVQQERHQQERQHQVTREPKVEDGPIAFRLHSAGCGHFFYQEARLFFVCEAEWRTIGNLGVVRFGKRYITVKSLEQQTELRISLNCVNELFWNDKGSIILQLTTPPHIFSSQLPIEEQMARLFFDAVPGQEDKQWRLAAIDSKHERIVPYCLVYQLSVAAVDIGTSMRLLRQRTQDTFAIRRLASIDSEILSCKPCDLGLLSFDEEVRALKRELSSGSALSFGLRFELQALVYNGYLHPRTVRDLARRIEVLPRTGRTLSLDTIKMLFSTLSYPSPDVDASELSPEGIAQWLLEKEDEMRHGLPLRSELLEDNKARVYRVNVSPARITMHGPEVEAMNRVLRKFPGKEDHFIRVQFADEDGEDLSYNPRVLNERAYERFKVVMQSGFNIAGRVFGFLGFSHSSLRAHSAWFMAPFQDSRGYHTNFSIIEGLGKFSDIRSPARQAARIGQAFSETPFTIAMQQSVITTTYILDVEANDRVFSDGVGTISEDAMLEVWKHIPQSKRAPTCFQIRHGGAKGMLSLDTTLRGRQICLRPSMIKFESSDVANLEICDMASKPIAMVLNRQMIKLLEDMGVPEKWFLTLQEQELARIRAITANNYNVHKLLRRENVGDGIRLPKFFRQTEGIEYRRDPFLRSVVEAVVLKVLRLVKHKARFPVDEGITLFGVMDETSFLREGEVFLTYDTLGYYAPPPGRQQVLVTRSPALHPGDIQAAQHVLPPDGHPLRELSNCIVFSSQGSRDLPSQLSGGDLDGDIYNVIWDRDLHPTGSQLKVFKPADYPRVVPKLLDREVTKDDMANFFIDFMEADHLGVIAVRHMILADLNEEGSLHPDCLLLAELHSHAVDFSKSGNPVSMKELPYAPRFRPDFLAPGPIAHLHSKHEILIEHLSHRLPDDNVDDDDDTGPKYKYYPSNKVLGKLYRAVDEEKIWYEDIRKLPPATGGATFWDEFLLMAKKRIAALRVEVNWPAKSEIARNVRHMYEDSLVGAMYDFSEHPTQPLSELEVFAGFLMSRKSSVANPRQRDRSRKLRDEFDRISGTIVSQLLDPTNMGAYAKEADVLELCLACVYVGGMKEGWAGKVRGRPGEGGLESFRVVAACALLRELERWEKGEKRVVHGGLGDEEAEGHLSGLRQRQKRVRPA